MYAATRGPNVKWGGTDFKWGAGHQGAITSTKTDESDFVNHNFVQFGKQHIKTNSEYFFWSMFDLSLCSRYEAILSSFVLSQQCCEICFTALIVAKPLWDLATKYYWNRQQALPFFSALPLKSRSVIYDIKQILPLCVSSQVHSSFY